MAAYAALVSVMQIIDQIEHHPRPPISLDRRQVESLTTNVTFLEEFLEGYAPTERNEGYDLESRILDAANAVEDAIESHIVNRIIAGSTTQREQLEFGQRFQTVIEDMDSIKNEAMEIKERVGVQRHRQRKSTSFSTAWKHQTTTVDYDDALLEILNKLTGDDNKRQVIPIVGMVGMGKTTLARNAYEHGLIKEHFDILAWAKISQRCDTTEILNEIFSQANQESGNSRRKNLKQIRNDLHKYLYGRRYLIVIDDVWSLDVWDDIKFFFPDAYDGSRIVVTTRLSSLARKLSDSYVLPMKFLNKDESWDLFSKIVFTREEEYPHEMVEIGKKIVEKCKGLPLSIIVVGSFLANLGYSREQWKHIEENLASFVNSHNDERCLKMSRLSYEQLPVHLKPCFLYMGLFEEDREIHASKLVKLWVAEGFLKPVSGKNLEEVAKEYLYDLVDRNLIFIMKSKRNRIKIHDLLRDLSLRQAQAERFYDVLQHGAFIHNHRRFVVSPAFSDEEVRRDALLSMSLARSMICYSLGICATADHKLLRICGAWYDTLNTDSCFQENKFQLVNLRYLAFPQLNPNSNFATSLYLLWSLQTLIIKDSSPHGFTAPAEIWNMPQLRHVHIKGYVYVPSPIGDGQGDIVLENLQTLKLVRNFKCREEVVKRIANIKKLGLEYVGDEIKESCLENLDRLNKLKSFKCISRSYPQPDGTNFLQKLSFPRLLKKLALDSAHSHWDDLLENIGSLPFLEKLKLRHGYFRTHAWETVEGHFRSLKFLKIDSCANLEYWNPESSHFPRLEHLVLCELHALSKIPSSTADMTTLKSIELIRCSNSIVISCKEIQEVRELCGEEDVNVLVRLDASHMGPNELGYLEGPNFKFSY